MPRDRIARATRALGVTVGVLFLGLGVAELVTHLDEPLSLFFWLPALWGGGALVLVGLFGSSMRPRLSLVLMIVGAFLGLLATAWTLVLPVLVFTFFVLVIVQAGRRSPTPAPHQGEVVAVAERTAARCGTLLARLVGSAAGLHHEGVLEQAGEGELGGAEQR